MDSPPDGRGLMTRLRWTTGERLTPIHAARSFSLGVRGVDESIVRGISGPMTELNHRLAAADLDLSIFWASLIRGVAAGETDLAACTASLTAAGCSPLSVDAMASAIASRLAEVRLVHTERYPKLAEQLELRGRPLREQWDGYGAGLLKRIGKLTHSSFLPKQVTAILVSPYRGGDGGFDAREARIWIEAVLTNSVADVPEILRLVWLVSQVGLIEALSFGSEDSHGDPWVAPARLPRVAALAMMAMTLEAGSYLELIPTPTHALPTAFAAAAQAWRIPLDPTTLGTLENWWKQFQDLQTTPPVTFKALDRMLHPTPTTHS
ncbi:MAG: hypothetical protein ACO1RT_01585 [Planctomycetaceae bacterium]